MRRGSELHQRRARERAALIAPGGRRRASRPRADPPVGAETVGTAGAGAGGAMLAARGGAGSAVGAGAARGRGRRRGRRRARRRAPRSRGDGRGGFGDGLSGEESRGSACEARRGGRRRGPEENTIGLAVSGRAFGGRAHLRGRRGGDTRRERRGVTAGSPGAARWRRRPRARPRGQRPGAIRGVPAASAIAPRGERCQPGGPTTPSAEDLTRGARGGGTGDRGSFDVRARRGTRGEGRAGGRRRLAARRGLPGRAPRAFRRRRGSRTHPTRPRSWPRASDLRAVGWVAGAGRSIRAFDPSRDDCDGQMTDLGDARRISSLFSQVGHPGARATSGDTSRTRARRPGAHTVARARRGRSDARDDAEEARARPREARGGIMRRRERPVVDDPRRDRARVRVPSFARTSGRREDAPRTR